jgi:hypothetical protein
VHIQILVIRWGGALGFACSAVRQVATGLSQARHTALIHHQTHHIPFAEDVNAMPVTIIQTIQLDLTMAISAIHPQLGFSRAMIDPEVRISIA